MSKRPAPASCEGKVVLSGHRLASAITRRQSKNDVGRTAYHCVHCGGWHLGGDQFRLNRRAQVSLRRRKEAEASHAE